MSRKNGFTLIELLVVISIIALLIAILMPALNVAREHATGAVCLSNQKSLMTGWLMYADDNDDAMVGGSTGITGDPWYNWVKNPDMINYPPDQGGGQMLPNEPLRAKQEACRQGKLYEYMKNVDVYHCPGDRRELKSKQVAFRSFSIAGGMRGVGDENGPGPDWEIYPYMKVSEVKAPAEKYVFVEESDDRRWNRGSWVLYPKQKSWVDPLSVWHNDQSTLGFADGHAEMHQWVDDLTVDMSRDQVFFVKDSDSDDFLYMLRRYGYRRLL